MIGRDIFVGVDPFVVGVIAAAMFFAVFGGFFALAALIGKGLKKLGIWAKP